MSFRTNAVKVQAFAGAMFGVQVGSTTMAQINADITSSGGLANALNAYYTSSFGNATTASVAASVAANLGLTGDALASGTAYITAQLNAAAAGARGAVISNILDQFAGLASDATFGAAATAYNAKVNTAVAYTGTDNVAIGSTLSQGAVFTLTTGVDNVTGTSGNDTINANPGTSNANTFTSLDNIDGGAGTDTLNVTEIGGVGTATAYTLNAAGTVKNVEVLNYTVASDNAGDAVTSDLSAWSGLTTANVVISGTDAPLTLMTVKGNVTAASIDGATTAAITDSATTDKLATVTVSNSTGLATLTSDALTTVNLTASSGGATVVAAAGTRALNVNLNGVTGGTVTDAEATSLTVGSSGTKTTATTLVAAKATSATINAAVETTVTDVTLTAAKTITATGAGAVTISALTDVTALITVDATGSTGGLSLGTAIGNAVMFTGGAGKDSVIVGATTKAITTGSGDDTITVAGTAALGVAGSIDAGEGTDTLKFSTYANAVTASATATFEGSVSGIERLELSGANGAAAAAINLANLDDINYVTLSATNTETTTISGMASGGTIAFRADQTATKDATVAVVNAATGTADVLNVVLSKATALAAVELIAADVETVNVTSTETATTLLGTVTHALELNATAAKALTISGNAGVTFGTLTGATALTSIDASAVTTGLVSFTTGALAAASTIKGGAGANTIVATAATKAVTYTGQDKVDTITINNAQNNSVATAGGNDVIVTGSGVDTIDAGAGDDTITSGTGLDQITGGAGNDTFNIVASANGNIFATIKDAAVGDKLSFTNLGTETFATTKLSLGGTAVFQDYLNLAAAGDGATHGAISWFQFGGNTYVVQDVSAGASFVNGTDMVVELTGLVNLATATGAGTHVITIA